MGKNDEFLEKEFEFNNAMKNPYANELNKAAAAGSVDSICSEEKVARPQDEAGSVDAGKSGALQGLYSKKSYPQSVRGGIIAFDGVIHSKN